MPAENKINHCIDFNGTNYVFVRQGTNSVWTASSPTGSWTLRTSAFTTSNPKHVYWCGDIFIALSTASQLNAIQTSPDGVTWTQRTISVAAALRVAAKCGNYYIVSGTGRTATTSNITVEFASIDNTGCGLHENAFFVNKQANKLVWSSGDGASVHLYDGLTNARTTVTSSQQQSEYALGFAMPSNTKIKWR
jgi:hypothetical protein